MIRTIFLTHLCFKHVEFCRMPGIVYPLRWKRRAGGNQGMSNALARLSETVT